jgi:hypothetical protein
MEKIFQHSIVKQGLIIAYYFSNRWYRKCLFNESSIPASNNTNPVKRSETDIKEPHKHKRSSNKWPEHKEKSDWDEDVKNPAIPKKTD